MVKKIIIDTDPGVDDSLAIFVALNSPELEVLGLTTIFGNAVTTTCTENALRLLEIAERTDIPVAEGAHIPLNGNFRGAATFVHGDNGQGNAELPLPTTKSLEIDAVAFLKETIETHPNEITLVPVGPLTNIANLLTQHPGVDKKIKEIVLMGGNAQTPGNATPTAEANILNDPEAADIVFSAQCEITMVGLDVTNNVFMSEEQVNTLGSFNNAKSKHINKINPFYFSFLKNFFEENGMPIHDSSAVTYLVHPEYFETIQHPIKVETLGISRGKTWMGMGISDNEEGLGERLKPWENRTKAKICINVDSEKVISFITQRISN
jgi:uridine nucleosidase